MRSYPSETHPETELSRRKPPALVLSISTCLVVVWVALMSRFGDTDVYKVMGPYACIVSVVCIALYPRELLGALACDVRSLLLGLGVGIGMTLLTYPVFSAAVNVMPSLQAQVAGLYQFASTTSQSAALFWVGALVIAEELLFRGVLPRALQPWATQARALTLAVLVYAAAQLGSGSFIVFLIALVCGTIWTALCRYTGSLTPSLIAHGIWSPTIIVLFPVT
ncbi:MAG TPA: CPBP family intramembrane glutamic endopeptidase [Polyangiales bacterium]|nr:CPBP family intramembrane glutamic endopeptidase [Polyangiales bacterium]